MENIVGNLIQYIKLYITHILRFENLPKIIICWSKIVSKLILTFMTLTFPLLILSNIYYNKILLRRKEATNFLIFTLIQMGFSLSYSLCLYCKHKRLISYLTFCPRESVLINTLSLKEIMH